MGLAHLVVVWGAVGISQGYPEKQSQEDVYM